ncbi:MAG: hypothetical protein IK076_03905, partial [Bacteroidales bacterium]|nr:hypothetical protein [Bacteroidales bacterium]
GTALGLDGILETAVGVSHNFDNKFNIGGRIKFLYGALSARVALDQMTASCATDTWTFNGNGSASFSSQAFKVKTDESGNLDVGEILDDIDVVEGLTNPGGIGAAIDLGATWNVLPWLTLSGALLDIGGMKWNRNIMGESPSGLSWKMVPDEDGYIDGLDALDVLMSFKNTSSKGSSFSMMPLTANLGAEARIPSYDRLSFGLLTSFRHSQVSNWGEGRLSANWNPGNALGLSLSTTVNNFGQFLGFAFNLHPGGINLFMGADYLPLSSRRLSYYADDDDMPSILKNLGIPTNRLNVNVYFGLNLAFGKRHLDHTGRIID